MPKHDPPCPNCNCEEERDPRLKAEFITFEDEPTYYRSWPDAVDLVIAGLVLVALIVLIIFVL